ncbi:cytochrome P450 [Methylocystaceae bacterium]|nr:cytochrome P450 [Methylocystaceae bacterium]
MYPINEEAKKESLLIDLDELDVSNRSRFRNNTVQYYFDRLRKEEPVHFCKNSDYGQFWSITKFKDIQEIEANHELFSSAQGYSIYDLPELNKSFVAMDPPEHKSQRSPILPLFSSGGLQNLEPTIRAIISNVCDGIPLNKPFDWVEKVSAQITNQILAIIIDVPNQDLGRLLKWSEVLTTFPEKESKLDLNNLQLMADFSEYFSVLWHRKCNSEPAHDLISMYAHSPLAKKMWQENFLQTLSLLIAATTDTTKNSMTGGVIFLFRSPKERDILYGNREFIKSAVSEIIRYQTPIAHMRRTATADTCFKGKNIRMGDKIILWYASANRDDEEIENPYDFCISRKLHSHHLSFGFGIHRCIGKNLAELELKILLEEIISRGWLVEPVGDPVRKDSCFINGINSLPVLVNKL